MQRLLFLLILLTIVLLINSQSCITSTKKTSFRCQYYPVYPNGIIQISATVSMISKYQVDQMYYLTGNKTKKNSLHILSIQCKIIRYNINDCWNGFQSSYISLEHINDNNCVMKIDEKDSQIKKILLAISLNKVYDKINLICTIEPIADEPKDSDENSLSGKGLFNIIFLSICIALTCGLFIGWFGIVYYRHFQQHRIKIKQQKELERSLQQFLDKSPIIIFNSNDKDHYNIDDDDPMCAICLESFIDNEKLRKLVCSHYFHVACIDPWLLTHQSCPLCNQNILDDSIPSISARITSANDERNNRESEPVDT